MNKTCATCRHWRGDGSTYRAACEAATSHGATTFDQTCDQWDALTLPQTISDIQLATVLNERKTLQVFDASKGLRSLNIDRDREYIGSSVYLPALLHITGSIALPIGQAVEFMQARQSICIRHGLHNGLFEVHARIISGEDDEFTFVGDATTATITSDGDTSLLFTSTAPPSLPPDVSPASEDTDENEDDDPYDYNDWD